MSQPALHPMSDLDDDVRLRTARSAVARLTLQLRSAVDDLERAEADATLVDDDDRAVEAELRAAVEARRLELDQQLDAERRDVARRIIEARRAALAEVEAAEAVAAERAAAIAEAEPAATERAAAIAEAATAPSVAAPAPVAPIGPPAPEEADRIELAADVDVAPEPPPVEAVVPHAHAVASGFPTPEYLAQIVSATVAATLSQVGALPPAARPVAPRSVALPKRTFWQKVAHLDVALPLLAVLVVFLVLLAWIG